MPTSSWHRKRRQEVLLASEKKAGGTFHENQSVLGVDIKLSDGPMTKRYAARAIFLCPVTAR